MKFLLVGLAVLATACGQLLNQYQAPLDSLAAIEEIETLEEPSNLLADNGYRYKTVKRIRYRHRRDVSELAAPEYLPPVQEVAPEVPSNEYLAPNAEEAPVPEYLAPFVPEAVAADEESTVLADDGYRYKTVRRFRTRHRRDVSELASPEYLPPIQDHAVELPSNEYLGPIAVEAPVSEIASGLLADDGYRYKTVRKLRHRNRRDVSELASPEYLPPVQDLAVQLPSNEYLGPIAAEAPVSEIASGLLADDGYRYKTVRKLRHRNRRDVSELASPEYLPPVQDLAVQLPANEYLGPIAAEAPVSEIASGLLADDGYRYKTVRKLRHRNRRDVSELASPEYLPPVQDLAVQLPANEYLGPIAAEAPVSEIASGLLADDGYRYKTVRKLRHRNRRDVSELASPEYLPPVQDLAVQLPSNEYLGPIAAEAPVSEIASGVLADDGYRYKTVRKLRHRHRRDVSELASPEYLPPIQDHAVELPGNEYLAPIAAEAPVSGIASGLLADDGYRYKTVRKLRHRNRRDVSELASPEYLPPVQDLAVQLPGNEYLGPIAAEAPVSEIASGLLADDGYRYKTVRKLRHRNRRDVSELASPEYLQPVQDLAVQLPGNEYLGPIAAEAPVSEIASGLLADDGYRYKTVRKLRHRNRRDVSELASPEYLPPVQDLAVQVPGNEYLGPIAAEAPVSEIASGLLADDGYRYKTVRKLRHRNRRDVSELASPEYLPPVQDLAVQLPGNEYLGPIAAEAPVSEIASGLLADDGYRYKTVRKLRHRNRRDVSELASPEYLPPVQDFAVQLPGNEYLGPIAAEAPVSEIASGLLADDGYRYKTVRKLRHRNRRDVSELASPEYLPPVQDFAVQLPGNEYLGPIAAEAPVSEIASGLLADDGYRYKTVRKLRHRNRRDVSELASPEYLPPVQDLAVELPSNEYLGPIAAEAPVSEIASGLLADDGYRYKTVRKLRHRHRRDVNEIQAPEYLPPVDAAAPAVADIPLISSEYLAPLQQHENILANDGYRYKTVKRFKVRRH